VKGDIRVGRLIVGETGAIDGNVSADYLEVRGRIVGGVTGKQVKLISTAYVDGDITAEQLSIDIGAYFQGRVLQSRREAPVPVAPAPRPVAPAVEAAPAQPAPVEDKPQIIDLKTI
jgi:cytoskeletal protein CcmA (bactofilin family)